MSLLSKTTQETRQIAADFLNSLVPSSIGTVVALEGDLGAGKTTFTQCVGEILGVEENMQSPTFVIMKVYKINFKGYKNLIHIDAYRIEKDSELLHLGWEEMTKEPENLIFIEWPSNVANLIPTDAKMVLFTFIDETTREIGFEVRSS